jgi:hypothetical protein
MSSIQNNDRPQGSIISRSIPECDPPGTALFFSERTDRPIEGRTISSLFHEKQFHEAIQIRHFESMPSSQVLSFIRALVQDVWCSQWFGLRRKRTAGLGRLHLLFSLSSVPVRSARFTRIPA